MSYERDIDINYTLLVTSPGTVVHNIDNGYNYHNLFDAMIDSFYSVLENAGTKNVTIVVLESGWPSARSNVANASNSQTYSQNLINHVRQGHSAHRSAPGA